MADLDFGTKTCSRCRTTKAPTLFSKNKRAKDGLNHFCKECSAAIAKAWREANSEHHRAMSRRIAKAYKQANEAGSPAAIEKTCPRCEDTKPANEFRRFPYSKDGLSPWCAACCRRNDNERHADPEIAQKRREAERARRLASPEDFKRRAKEFYENNKELFFSHNRKRRARTRGASGSHTLAEIRALLAAQKGRCVYCHVDMGQRYTRDHIVPLISGGSDDISNIQLVCRTCNCKKGRRDPIDFANLIGKLL
jgi:hypothetical protein